MNRFTAAWPIDFTKKFTDTWKLQIESVFKELAEEESGPDNQSSLKSDPMLTSCIDIHTRAMLK